MVYNTIYWINAVPAMDGVSETQGSSTIVTGNIPNCKTHCDLEFGSYCQVNRETNNTMNSHTFGALTMRPMGNGQGGY